MTVEKLLQPRYKVIADYPKSLYHVGDILNAGWRSEDLIYCDHDGPRWRDYPHLFRKLEWWEEREVSEMPEYLKFHNGEVIKVKNWNMESLGCDREDGGGCNLTLWSKGYGYTPATLAEYQSYLTKGQ